jgi:hypothetical protein
MQLYCSSIGTAMVAMIYVIYGVYRDRMLMEHSRDQVLRQRVAYMLWVMAEQVS